MNKENNKKIELLAPAGDLERLKTAVVFGADAVYCGLPEWSLRNPREITFTLETLQEGIKFAHERGAKVYLTFNVFLHEEQVKETKKILKNIKKIPASPAGGLENIDGVIVSDLGMLSLVKKYLPKVPIHISTQANTLNSEAVLEWQKLGAERVVLAREVTLKEIKEIKKSLDYARDDFASKIKIKKSLDYARDDFASKIKIRKSLQAARDDFASKIKIECFGHGAMCIAYSGRCLLSKYFTGREANLGDCAQSCRWRYKLKVKSEKLKVMESLPASSAGGRDGYYIEEETRPDDLVEIQEDPNGTYLLNSKEICSLDILDQFIEAGIDSLKIEGRAKTVYYLATVVRAYRKAIDLYYKKLKNQEIKKLKGKWSGLVKELYEELNLVQNRGYSHGFLLGRDDYEQEYEVSAFKPGVIFLGVVKEVKSEKLKVKSCGVASPRYLVEVKNKFAVKDEVEIITPNDIYKTKVLEIENEKGEKVDEILTPQEKVLVTFDIKKEISERSIIRKRTK